MEEPGSGTVLVPLGLMVHLAKAGIANVRFVNPEALSGSTLPLLAVPGLEYRDSQREAASAALGRKLGNLVVPMAVGKTSLLVGLALSVRHRGNVLVLAPTLVTLNNLLRALRSAAPGAVWYSKQLRDCTIPESGQIVVSVGHDVDDEQIHECNPGLRDSVRALLCDEAQNWHKRGWVKALYHFPQLERSYSVSATSISSNEQKRALTDMSYKSAYAIAGSGPVVYRASVASTREYIDVPIIINFRYSWLPQHQTAPEVEVDEDGNFASIPWKVYSEVMEENKHRRAVLGAVVKVLQSYGRISVIPVATKVSAKELAAQLDPDLTYCWFGGDHILKDGKPAKEKQVLDDDGPGLTIIATPHLGEGWNFPSANAMVLHHGKDRISIVQRSGRVIRKSDVRPVVINFADDYSVFGGHATTRLRNLTGYYKVKAVHVNSLKELREFLNGVR